MLLSDLKWQRYGYQNGVNGWEEARFGDDCVVYRHRDGEYRVFEQTRGFGGRTWLGLEAIDALCVINHLTQQGNDR